MKRFLLIGFFGFFINAYNCSSQNVVISEIYGGGGNSGATYKNDFIELYNPTSSPISLLGWSVQYVSATGSTWSVTTLSGSIAAGGYYLIQEAAGTGGTVSLPIADAAPGTINMSGTAGKVALVSSTTALSGASPSSASIADLVGFGTANFFEGSVAPAPSNINSIERKANTSSTSSSMKSGGADEYLGNGYDSNNNGSDFVTRLPQPQNSASGIEPDVTAPTFTSTYPQIIAITDVQFDLVASLSEVGKVYYVVLADGATAPSATQVRAGQDNSGNMISNSGFISVTTSGSIFSTTIAGLSPSTDYDLYVVAEDLPKNLQASPIEIDARTGVSTAPDISLSTNSIIFPGFTAKSHQSGSQSYTISAVNLIADVNVSALGNFLISSDDATYGTALTLTAANFSSPQTVYVKFNPSGNIGTQTGTVTNSTVGATNKEVTLSAVAIDPFTQDFNDVSFLSNSGWTQYNNVGAQVWGSTNFGRACLTGCDASTSDKATQMNGYAGGPLDNEDWLISPLMDITAFVNYPSLSFWTISAFAGDRLQLKYSTDYIGSGDPSNATWTAIDGKFPTTNSSVWTNSTNIILPKSKIYVAFVYTSNTISASRWTIDDWQLSDVLSYLDVSNINFSFGEVLQGNNSTSQNFTFSSQGYGDITITAPDGYEVSTDNSVFAKNTLVTQADAANQKTIYVRLSPLSKQIKWTGSINFQGTGLDASYGSLVGSSYQKSETFNIVTYNMEFFGTDVKDATGFEFGPTDDVLQVNNVTSVMQTLAADVFSVEEISDDNAFNQLVSNLTGYNKVVSVRWSHSFQPPDANYPPQKTGFIYNTSKVQLVNFRVMFAAMYDSILSGTKTLPNYPTGTSSSFWASGRLPFMATFEVTVNGTTRRVRMINIHAKSGSDQASYDRRVYDANVLRDSLNQYYKHDNVILLGDFNDDVYKSITTGAQSSYKSFVDDAANFNVLTYTMDQSGVSTFPSSASFIDNIIITNQLVNAYVNNSVTVEDPRPYISNYSVTTSDHLPVSARFLLSSKADQTIVFDSLVTKFYDEDITLNANASSGLAVVYSSSDPEIASINGNTVTINKVGRVNITASQEGSSDYNPAADVVQSLTINKSDQVITFDPLITKTFNDEDFILNAEASSELPITYSSSDPTIASINGNLVTVLKAGSVNITASQEGSSDYNPAADVVQPLTINKASQSISFNALSEKTLEDVPFGISATASSALTVNFSVASDKITINGSQVTLVKAGRAYIRASQAGNENYDSASSVDQNFCIDPPKPIIALTDVGSIALTSSATSGNQWYRNLTIISGATQSTLIATDAGTYSVQAHVDDCMSQFSDDQVIVITGIASQEKNSISIYPNPVEDYLFIFGIQEAVPEMQVIDFIGKTFPLTIEKYNEVYRVDVKEFSSGIYIARINQEGKTHSLKFIKK